MDNSFVSVGGAEIGSTYQHIAIWTLLQLLDTSNRTVADKLNKQDKLVRIVENMAAMPYHSAKSASGANLTAESYDDEIISLARRVLTILKQ